MRRREDLAVGSAVLCAGHTAIDFRYLPPPRPIWFNFQLPVVLSVPNQLPRVILPIRTRHGQKAVDLRGSHLVLRSWFVEMLLEVNEDDAGFL